MKNEKVRSVLVALLIALAIFLILFVVAAIRDKITPVEPLAAYDAQVTQLPNENMKPEEPVIEVIETNTPGIVEEQMALEYDSNGFPVVGENTVMKLEVNLAECKTRLYFQMEEGWEQVLENDCIVGADNSPTPVGDYQVTNLDPGGFSKGGNWYRYVLVWYVPNGDYAHAYCFHTVAEDSAGNARDDVISGHLSAGCVRLPHETCKWLCEHVPVGTSVHIE